MPQTIQQVLLELEHRVLNHLHERKRGQTAEDLKKHFAVPRSYILTVLHKLRRQGQVTESKGVWKLAQPEP